MSSDPIILADTKDMTTEEWEAARQHGPDGSLDSNLPPAKKYWDDSQSFTTNEVAIYYNSPLVFVLSAFKK